MRCWSSRASPRTRTNPRFICVPRSTMASCGSTSATTPAARSGSRAAGGQSRTVPVLFKRTSLTAPLPEPERGGSIEDCGRGSTLPRPTGRWSPPSWSPRCSASSRTWSWPSSASTGPARQPRSRSSSSSSTRARCPSASRRRDADSWVTAAAGSWVVGARQPLGHPALAVRLAVPRLDRRRRRAP